MEARVFVIDKWARGYETAYIEALMMGLEPGTEAICSGDDKEWAPCYEGTTMYDKAKAVCRLLIGGTSACTGWLLGSEGHVKTIPIMNSWQRETHVTPIVPVGEPVLV
jgi:hypothetical protein